MNREQMSIVPFRWQGDRLLLLDQMRLPGEERWLELADHRQLAEAIRSLRVRGAPAIGVAAAYGLALAALSSNAADRDKLLAELEADAQELAATRPTAVNLSWALRRTLAAAREASDVRAAIVGEAQRIEREDVEANRRLGALGAELVPDGATVLTHCNAGALATAGYGTALGVVRAAVEQSKQVRVVATETRPALQGARLTAWELSQDGIPCTVIVDSAAGALMRRGEIDLVLVGADRIAANGDTANKIGTYTLATLARAHELPLYVAAPTSTIDPVCGSGDDIPIEDRPPDEITAAAPAGVTVANPAFDVTPHELIDAIITERGIARAPYTLSIAAQLERAEVPA
jgi:methylthioribose-1-phosphate isomerase